MPDLEQSTGEKQAGPSLKRNVIASYVSQFFMTVVSLVMLPIYLRYMGLEAYGLVGVFLMLQGWLALLDFGLSATIMREAARYRAGAIAASDLRNLLIALEVIFFAIATIAATALALGSGWLAQHWLKVESLDLATVRMAILFMAPAIAMRFVSGLLRSLATGFEDLVWLAGFNIIIAILRFVMVLPAFEIFGGTPRVFFLLQILVAAFELIVLVGRSLRMIPHVRGLKVDFAKLRPLLGFSLSAAFVGSIWVVITQIDKLLLSAILPLAEYAIFSLVALVANGLLVVTAPISSALVPRLMKLHAAADDASLVSIFRRATQFTAATALPAAIVIVVFARKLLWVWTGNPDVVGEGSRVLSFYAAGTGLLTISSFAAYLQYARGDLRLHVIGMLLFLLLLVPLIVWAATNYGAIGAGAVWLALNAAYLVAWVPVVFRRFLPQLYARWLLVDVIALAAPAIAVALVLRLIVPFPADRLTSGVVLVCIGTAVVIAAASASTWMRSTAATALLRVRRRLGWV